MQVLRLLAARRGAATAITAPTTAAPEPTKDSKPVVVDEENEEYDDDDDDDDEGSFFELDLSIRAGSSSSTGSASASSGSSDDDALSSSSLTDLDFVISLHRTRDYSASPSSFHFPAAPPTMTTTLPLMLDLKPSSSGGSLRTLSFAGVTATARTRNNGAAALYGGRRSSSSFARTSAGARSLRLFMESAADADADEDPVSQPRRAPSRDVIRRYFTKISTRLRRSVRPGRRRGGGEGGRLRKSRSASAAVMSTTTVAASRRDDSLAEKQDGIASAIAHCKESLHRASLSMSLPDCGSPPLPRSLSDPGSRQAP